MQCFETAEERARIAREIIEYGHVECEAKTQDHEGNVEVVTQKTLQWNVRSLGALCILRAYSHRNIIVDGEPVRMATPFFSLHFKYERAEHDMATAYIDFDPNFANVKTHTPPRENAWDEAMAVCDESLRDMHRRVHETESQVLAPYGPEATIA